jgi:hypothetical protein
MANNLISRGFLAVFLGCFAMAWIPGCRKWRVKNTKDVLTKERKNLSLYALSIDGIECKQCIGDILVTLRDSHMVRDAECLCQKNDYATAQIHCFVEKSDQFSIPAMSKKLEQHQFVIKSITGQFTGTVTQQNNQVFFISPTIGTEVALVYAPEYSARGGAVLAPSDQKKVLSGTLFLDKNQLVVHESIAR